MSRGVGPPYRVVFLLQELKLGGTQRQALELARTIDRTRFQVELWAMQAGDDFLPEAELRGLKVVWLGRGSYVWPPALFRLHRGLSSHRPDLVLMLTGIPNIWGRLLGRRAGGPVLVASIRGSQDPWLQHERWLHGLAHHHVTNAFALKELLIGHCPVAPGRVSVIPNGVDLERFVPGPVPLPSRRSVVLCLGRLVPVKDHACLIDAFERIAPAHAGAQLWIVGDGPLKAPLSRRIQAGPCASRITIRPGVTEVIPLLHQARCLALASRHEGFPNVVLEALASGLPVVASALPGLVEILGQGHGLLFPPGDAAALAGALDRLLSDDALAFDLGRRGREHAADRFGLQVMARAYEALFDRLLEERSGRSQRQSLAGEA